MKNISKVAVAVFLTSSVGLALAGGGGMMPINNNVNWTGPYMGIQVGVQSNSVKRSYSSKLIPGYSDVNRATNTGIAGDLMLGYGFQMQNNIYLGLEGQVGLNNIRHKASASYPRISPTYALVANLGYALKPGLLLYVSGGYANAKVKQVLELATDSSNRSGYTLGAGFKSMLTKSIFVTGNASYASLSSKSVTHLTLTEKLNPSLYKVMFGLGYKF